MKRLGNAAKMTRRIRSIRPGDLIVTTDDDSDDPEGLALVLSLVKQDCDNSHWLTFVILFNGRISTVDLLKNDVVSFIGNVTYVHEYHS